MFFILFLFLLAGSVCEKVSEFGSYRNPQPRPYERCEAQDLIQLSNCCNDVLAKLSDCKSNDLACECCALQSMNPDCYNICPSNPNNNFLAVLFKDCEHLNDINACNLPFNKENRLPSKDDSVAGRRTSRLQSTLPGEHASSVSIKSKMGSKHPAESQFKDLMYFDDDTEEEPERPVSILPNVTANTTRLQSRSSRVLANTFTIIMTMVFTI